MPFSEEPEVNIQKRIEPEVFWVRLFDLERLYEKQNVRAADAVIASCMDTVRCKDWKQNT